MLFRLRETKSVEESFVSLPGEAFKHALRTRQCCYPGECRGVSSEFKTGRDEDKEEVVTWPPCSLGSYNHPVELFLPLEALRGSEQLETRKEFTRPRLSSRSSDIRDRKSVV